MTEQGSSLASNVSSNDTSTADYQVVIAQPMTDELMPPLLAVLSRAKSNAGEKEMRETQEQSSSGYSISSVTTDIKQEDEHEEERGSRRGPRSETEVVVNGHHQQTGTDDREDKTTQLLEDQTNLLPKKQLLVVFTGLSAAMFCSMLDQTIVTTALPTIGLVFNDAQISSWVGTSYLLTSTAFQPLYGRWSDIFGRKLILLGSLGLFFLGSVLCATAKSMIALIVFRAIQGIGGGGIFTTVTIVVSDVVSLKDRGKYQGIIGAVLAVSSALGPLVGGLFTEKVSWRWCFYINLPLTGIAMVIAGFALPIRSVRGNMLEKLKKLDYLGSGIILAASILILLPISWAGTSYPWVSAAVLAPLSIGLALVAVFIYIELKLAKIPIMPLHVFKNVHVSVCIATSFLTGYTTFVNLYYLPQFYQVVRGSSPLHSGILVLPMILSQTIASFAAGYLVSKTGNYKINLLVGYALWTVASGLLTTISTNTTDGALVGYQLLSGIGSGQTLQITLVAIQAAVKRNEMAVVTGTRNFLRMLGSTLAVACCAAVLNNTVRTRLESLDVASDTISTVLSDPTQITTLGLPAWQESAALDAYLTGVQLLYYMMVGLSGLQFFMILLGVKDYSLNREDDEKQKEAAKAWLRDRKDAAGNPGIPSSDESV